MRVLVFSLIALLLTSLAWGAVIEGAGYPDCAKMPAYRIYYPGDPIAATTPINPAGHHREPFRDLGERTQVGDTWYDYQTNGVVGKMIAVDRFGRIHLCWMDAEDNDLGGGERHMKYNCKPDRDGNDVWRWEDGTQIENGSRGGYGCMWISNDDQARAIPFCHATVEDAVTALCCYDWGAGWGGFQNAALPRYPDSEALWPQGVLSPQNRLHVVMNKRSDLTITYAAGTWQNNVPNFPGNAIQAGDTHMNAYRIARSPHSERAAITYLRSRVDNNPDLFVHDNWSNSLAYQMHNDLMLVYTDNGVNWNFDDPINVTNNIFPDPQQEGAASYGDTLFCFVNHDVIFDSEDFIHIVFEARLLKVQAIPVSVPPVDALTLDESILFHWSEDHGQINAVANGWYDQFIRDENGTPIDRNDPGAWKSNVTAPSLAFGEDGTLYCVFNIFPQNDYSIHHRCNGDIAVTLSEDNGETWYMPTMITQTNSLGAEEGHHLCECYPTLAEKVDDNLHITYELDTEPGTTIQQADVNLDVRVSLCEWYYHEVPVDQIERERIWEDPPSFHIQYRPAITEAARTISAPHPEEAVPVNAIVSATGNHEIESVILEYLVVGVDSIPNQAEMQNEFGDRYVAEIPGQAEGANVWYRVRAVDNHEMQSIRPDRYWYSYMVRDEGELTIRDVQYPGPKAWGVDYSPYKDYQVTVTGIVTTPSSFVTNYGAFAIQMETADYFTGIFVRDAAAELNLNLPIGSRVQVTGTVRERDPNDPSKWAYLTYIEVESARDIIVVGQIPGEDLPYRYVRDIQDISSMTYYAEDLEGMLVRVDHVVIGDTATVNDALLELYIPITTNDTTLAFITTHGLNQAQISELGLNRYEVGDSLRYISGVFAENQWYAIALMDEAALAPFSVSKQEALLPEQISLAPVYPNPFNAATSITFRLPAQMEAAVKVFDITGRQVALLQQGRLSAGRHTFTYDASALASGIYILRLETPVGTLNRKMALVK